MATIPGISEQIKDFNLGIQNPNGPTSAVIGYCAVPTEQQNTLIICHSLNDVAKNLVAGPGAELTAKILNDGGGTVYVVPCAPGVAASTSSIVSTFALANVTASFSASCTPYDAYSAIVTIVSGGAQDTGAVTYQFSLDGGNNFSPTTVLPTSKTASLGLSGIQIVFSGAGSLTGGDKMTFTSTDPGLNSSVVVTAMNNLQVSASLLPVPKFIAIVGNSGSTGVAQATMAAAVVTEVDGYFTNDAWPTYAMIESSRTDTDLNNVIAFNIIADKRLQACGGLLDLTSPLTGRVLVGRSVLYSEAAVRQISTISQPSERVKTGALIGVTQLYNNQFLNDTLDSGRFCTATTIPMESGFYITNGKMMAQEGSDYEFVEHLEVINQASITARAAMNQFIGDTVQVNPATGTILPNEAKRIADFVTNQLNNVLVGQVSALQCSIDQTNDILATSQLLLTIVITPRAKIDQISITLELGNITGTS